MQLFKRPVYPVTPAYLADGTPDWDLTTTYIQYLDQEGATTCMTTAGTSQFNLLTPEEIFTLNQLCQTHFSGRMILGLAPSATMTTLKEIDRLNAAEWERTSLLLLFPDRYYHQQDVLDFFFAAANRSNYPVLFHGNPIKKGTGGQLAYDAELVDALAAHPNIVGMKEESPQYTGGYELCKNLTAESFSAIVAGGSMRRYWMMQGVGATTFLTGLGSLWPQLAEQFADAAEREDLNLCRYIINTYENPFFDVFMKIGWHPSFREALRLKGLCGYDRAPFPQLLEEEKRAVKTIVEQIETQITHDKRLDIRTL